VPIGELVHYRIPLVANAHRFRAGHRVRLFLTSDDQDAAKPAMLEFRHASVGTNCLSSIYASSRLLLPILPET
jgi:predicted acyl esterase